MMYYYRLFQYFAFSSQNELRQKLKTTAAKYHMVTSTRHSLYFNSSLPVW